jgi:hypothetical protein
MKMTKVLYDVFLAKIYILVILAISAGAQIVTPFKTFGSYAVLVLTLAAILVLAQNIWEQTKRT